MKSTFAWLTIMMAAAMLGGCSHLTRVEHTHSLDVQDSVDGVKSTGNNFARSEQQAERQILARKVEVVKDEGFKVEVVNYSIYTHKYEIRKTSVLLINPVEATFLLSENETDTTHLTPGYHDVYCWEGAQLIWKKTYQVSTAPSYDGITKQEVHCIMGHIDDQRFGMRGSRYGNRRF